MVRKFLFALGILLGVSALVVDGTASTAEACWGCRTSCCRTTCRPRCCEPVCVAPSPPPCYSGCYSSCRPRCRPACSSCYAPVYAPVYAAPVYSAPACSSCSAQYVAPGAYGYVTPINVGQVPGYGARYGYAAPVIAAPSSTYRVRTVSLR